MLSALVSYNDGVAGNNNYSPLPSSKNMALGTRTVADVFEIVHSSITLFYNDYHDVKFGTRDLQTSPYEQFENNINALSTEDLCPNRSALTTTVREAIDCMPFEFQILTFSILLRKYTVPYLDTAIGDMFETPNNKYNFLPVTPPRTPRRRKLPLVMPPERLAILPSRKTNPYRPTIPVLNIPPPSNGGQALLPISQIPMYDLSSGFIGYSDSPPGSPRSEERTYSYNPKMQNSFTSSSRKSPRIKDINKDVSYHSSERRPLSEKALPPLQKLW